MFGEVRCSMFGFNVRRTSRTFGGYKKAHFLPKKLTKMSNAFGNFVLRRVKLDFWVLSDFKIFSPNFLFLLFSPNYFCLHYYQYFWFCLKVRCSVLPVRSSVSKFGHHVRSVQSSVCQCSRCSKFGILMFVPPLTHIQKVIHK